MFYFLWVMKLQLEKVNEMIQTLTDDAKSNVSDWYHTFGELYDHRCILYVALCNLAQKQNDVIFRKSKIHYDWSEFEGWFILQGYIEGKQISYHLPNIYRDKVRIPETDIADERDWHTSQDVLDRLLLV